jgi:hypothetical protein
MSFLDHRVTDRWPVDLYDHWDFDSIQHRGKP